MSDFQYTRMTMLRQSRIANMDDLSFEEREALVDLLDSARALMKSSSRNMTHRNAAERDAYKAMRGALNVVEGL